MELSEILHLNLAISDEAAMLKGNINRMCVTSDLAELENMREWAEKRIDFIYRSRLSLLDALKDD